MGKIVVLIIDGQPIFRAGVRKALAQHNGLETLEILDCAPGIQGEEAKRQISENSPDVALLDINLDVDRSSPSGLDLGSYISRHFPATKVVMLSGNTNADELFHVVKTGAVAYLCKDSTAEELLDAIRRVSSGEYLINDNSRERPGVAERVLEQFQNVALMGEAAEASVPKLTPKEIEFLKLIGEDNPNRQIAAILGISEQDVKGYVSVILRKLNACDRAHSVMLALCNDWLSIESSENVPQPQEQLDTEPVQLEKVGPARRSTKSTAKSRRRGSTKSGEAAILTREAPRKR